MSLRVLHVLDHSVPTHTGYAFRTLAILREQHKLGWETLQVTTPRQGESAAADEVVEGFRFLRTSGGRKLGLAGELAATARAVKAAVEAFRPDVIHAHSPVLTALPALLTAKTRGVPIVYEIRALWEDAAVDHGSTSADSPRYRVSRMLETFALRRVDHVTVICTGLRNEMATRGLSSADVTVIPNAVDVERFEFAPDPDPEVRGELELGDAPTIGFAGSFYGYEGLDYLLETVKLLRSRSMDVRAVLLGGGPEDERLRRRSNELGLDGSVRFLGRVDNARVRRYYGAIDVLVYPRRKTRLTDMVTPLKPLEAMAAGKLVLASDVGGHRELVRDGDTGTLFRADDVLALADAVSRLFADKAAWSAMRDRGRRYVTVERTWARSVAEYRGAYRSALRRRGRQHADL
jgi:PEP-CTERM/exosortase A-associated glycosyltransferase